MGLRSYKQTCIAVLCAVICAIAIAASPFGQEMERIFFDLHAQKLAPKKAPKDVVIVALDDISFDIMAEEMDGLHWPYPRAVHAQVVENLKAAGAKAIFFDFIFDLESGYGDLDDASFQNALTDIPIVLAAEDSDKALTEPLEQFTNGTGRAANAALPLDVDGAIRETSGSAKFAASTLQALKFFAGFNNDSSHISKLKPVAEELYLATSNSKIAPRGAITYFGKEQQFQTISYFEAYNLSLLEPYMESLKDKVIFIGSTPSVSITPDQQTDVYKTPVGMMPGVIIHAHHYASLIKNRIKQFISGPLIPFGLLVWIFFQWLGFTKFSRPILGFGFLLIGVALWEGIYLISFSKNLILPGVLPLLLSSSMYVSGLVLNYIRERDERLLTKAQLCHYLPARVAEHVLKNPNQFAMGGDKKVITILFADVAGFTTLSEEYPPEEVLEILQTHLRDMAEVIFAKEGTLDKYLGDGIMAFWGAPEAMENHADLAVQAATEMLIRVEQQNVVRRAEGTPELLLRIGVHTGEAIVGNIGSELFIDYTAIGDSVNSAARLEGVNKQFGTTLIVSDDCVNAFVGNKPKNLFPLGRFAVKGKSEPIGVNTVAFSDQEKYYRLLEKTLELFDAGDISQAKHFLEAILEESPEFGPAIFHLGRIIEGEKLQTDQSGRTFWPLHTK